VTTREPRYRIHPAIGIARLGDAARAAEEGEGWYLGPENPDERTGWDAGRKKFRAFKSSGKVLAQGVRFRVFKYAEGRAPEEIRPTPGGEVVRIRWRVEVANRKAAFFKFLGPVGQSSLYNSLHWLPFTTRNARMPSRRREAQLVLRAPPGEIGSGEQGQCRALVNEHEATRGAIPALAELRVDAEGRLIFCGGYGRTAYLPELNKGVPRHETLSSFANNDGWFDDIADGPVSAVLDFADGTSRSLAGEDGAWAIAAPPDFAPAILPARSMWDSLVDLLVREDKSGLDQDPTFHGSKWHEMAKDWDAARRRFSRYRPSFTRDILPILEAAHGITGVFSVAERPVAHRRFDPPYLAVLGGSGSNPAQRLAVFARLRPPGHRDYDETMMPLAHGDSLPLEPSGGVLAWLEKIATRLPILPRTLLSLTELQYALLARWAEGDFDADYGAATSSPSEPEPLRLDRAALQAAVGGAFFPGIEASWLLLDRRIHAAPLRLAPGRLLRRWTALGPLRIGPGFLTAQMALPWQADFASCRKTFGQGTGNNYVAWWPSQRPDDVWIRDGESGEIRPRKWAPEIDVLEDDAALHQKMVADWSKQDFVVNDETVGLHLQVAP
jgi:hypothetical protein